MPIMFSLILADSFSLVIFYNHHSGFRFNIIQILLQWINR